MQRDSHAASGEAGNQRMSVPTGSAVQKLFFHSNHYNSKGGWVRPADGWCTGSAFEYNIRVTPWHIAYVFTASLAVVLGVTWTHPRCIMATCAATQTILLPQASLFNALDLIRRVAVRRLRLRGPLIR